MNPWLEAIRLRTLPLALSSIGMGSFLAATLGQFNWQVFVLCALTTVFLQILSNLANDYGDSVHGADSAHREGPQRAVQAGKISGKAMKTAIIMVTGLSLLTGLYLLYVAIGPNNTQNLTFFLLLGILAIVAAITYTAGMRPYGYAGLGDISVLIFFGWVGVLGTFYLHTGFVEWDYVLPATSCGLFATAVLNVNNIRDIESDRKANKRSIPVRIGRQHARRYHWMLLGTGFVCALAFVLINFQSFYQLLFIVVLPLLVRNGQAVMRLERPAELDPYLRQMAVTTLLFVLTFGLGQLVG